MPTKTCCCVQPPPPEPLSCCRPIYNRCLNKTYVFSIKFTARYPCMNFFAAEQFYDCKSSNKRFSIPGNPETYEIVVRHTINKVPKISDRLFESGDGVFYSANNFGCFGEDYDPTNPNTWKNSVEFPPEAGWPFGSRCNCTGCDCYTVEPYASCNFGDDKLSDCECSSGQKNWIYGCPNGEIFSSPYGPEFLGTPAIPRCSNGFGAFADPTLLLAGSYPTNFWCACYEQYYLGRYSDQFVENDSPNPCTPPYTPPPGDPNCRPGCSATGADQNIANIADSYSIQFIPNPAYPEQLDENYLPKLQPELISFQYHCSKTARYYGNWTEIPRRGYNIDIKLALGYSNEFNCGTDEEPVYETLEFPLTIFTDPFTGIQYFFGGPTITAAFNRPSFESDPMNMCVPLSTQRYSQDCLPYYSTGYPGLCYNDTSYWDEYRQCLFGREKYVFTPDFFEPAWQNVIQYCPDTLNTEAPTTFFNQCQWFAFENTILVEEE